MEDVGRKLGVTVVGAYTAPAQHIQFLVLETDNLDQLTTFLKPLYKIGKVDIVPVMKASKRLTELVQVAPPVKSVDYYCMTCRIDFAEDEKYLHKAHKFYTCLLYTSGDTITFLVVGPDCSAATYSFPPFPSTCTGTFQATVQGQ